MQTFGSSRDGGAFNFLALADIHNSVAGAGTDNAEQNGAFVDRKDYTSVDVYLAFTATLAAAATLTLVANLQDSADGSNGIADFTLGGKSVPSTVIATGPGGGGTVTGLVYLGRWDLTMAKRFVRVQFTTDLSASGTDTASVAAFYSFNGGRELPIQTPLNA